MAIGEWEGAEFKCVRKARDPFAILVPGPLDVCAVVGYLLENEVIRDTPIWINAKNLKILWNQTLERNGAHKVHGRVTAQQACALQTP